MLSFKNLDHNALYYLLRFCNSISPSGTYKVSLFLYEIITMLFKLTADDIVPMHLFIPVLVFEEDENSRLKMGKGN